MSAGGGVGGGGVSGPFEEGVGGGSLGWRLEGKGGDRKKLPSQRRSQGGGREGGTMVKKKGTMTAAKKVYLNYF